MGKLVVISLFVAALSAFLGERIINLRKRTLASRKLVQTHLPNCHPIKSLEYGSEDLTILPNGLAIISTAESFLHFPDNSVYLFVVNHPQKKTQVEIFLFVEEDHSLVYVKTIKHEFLHSVNDIVAVGVESFYATNDHYFSGGTLNTLEVLLAQPWSNVVYYSPEEVKVVAEGFYMANGINISPDKRHIYVADLFDHNIHVLERLESNGLAPVKVVEVGSLVDNIYVDPETGDLWIGCHPNGWKLFRNDPEDLPGSEVIQIKDIHSEKPVVTQVYADDGSVLIGSSVAAPYGGKLLIGTIYQKALVCDLAKVDQ
ncbi:serum paraoxonase/arylesterase 2 [Oncorhynchus mykiss]|uniref:serum paraoxonase/arylesterase 2 n=1 Tax=Oncorhynchus mykiss TaxID=8022 RepID=UPI001877D48C|nr:serum paraoxonase/arylesterase 2 [Oncorhynchus mykiss]